VYNRDILISSVAARLIQMAISRSREYRADASGAAITGDPLALASALRKLEMGTRALPLPPEPSLQTTSSMMIANPFRREGMSNWFSTHPPMAERIARSRRWPATAAELRCPRRSSPGSAWR